MFIPYDPADGKNKHSRRTINAFVAVQAAKKRRKPTELDRGINTYWLQSSHSNAQNDRDRQDPESKQGWALAQAHRLTVPIGTGKFYPMKTLDTKGPSTARALTYYFDVMLPHDSNALGHEVSRAQFYASFLLHWSNTHDAILHGLAAFTLCNLEPQDHTGTARAATLYHRKKLFDLVTDMLARQTVDDLLIQALCLLIPIDDYLGYVDYSQAHLDGIETVVRARGGHDQVGQSIPGMAENLQTSLLVSKSLLLSHIQTSLSHTAPPVAHDRLDPELFLENTLDRLPIGFTHLIQTGHLTTGSILILQSFSAWLYTHGETHPSQIPVWRYSAPQRLNPVEKCLFAALLCFADDISCMGFHPAALIFRQPKKRAEMLLAVSELWADPVLADCLLWLAMVITTPRNLGITPFEVQGRLFQRIFEMRAGYCEWECVEPGLRYFFYDDGRAVVWEQTWNALYNEYLTSRLV
ncbi:hypothetical protein BJX76DRAFT_232988 [Aspergillus varians]